jgi:hypothetical protein
MSDHETTPIEPGSRKEKIATKVIEIAKLDTEKVPVERGWQMFRSVITGGILVVIGVGILYAGLRVYVETKGGAFSWPVLAIGAGFVLVGGNVASGQLVGGALSTLIAPIRRLVGIARGKDE